MRRALAASLTGALAALLAGVAPAVAAPAVTTTPQPTTSAPAAPVVGGAALARGGVVTDLPAGVPAPPGLAAASWLVADLGTGDVLAAKGAHAQHLPASTLKSLTALTLLPQARPLDGRAGAAVGRRRRQPRRHRPGLVVHGAAACSRA
ncbi:hypothetical protein GCM10025868_34900 [Angustibacter aerolatus]|uniref:Peptidase S11 D-alanyl-D-alanine carboxypeptidase A N-terminal domain-containing protein n=1 Tax=Angustibacter aerolatus TaxID=1162965 RepID=A0ABQ6JNA5_9ACTN|nr:hypothetical protein [Angustibacter aerolatus]GMA88240.1 hypothetical protein GCM10025868_34900 [Angustibacter aerolatus]